MRSMLVAIVSGLALMPLLVGCCCAIPFWTVTSGGVTGSGAVVTVESGVTDFDALDVSHAFEVDVTQGPGYRVVVSIDENLEQYLQLEKRGSTLIIGLEPGRAYNLSNATLEAEITMPALAGARLSGAASMKVTGFESTTELELSLSGSSGLDGGIEAGDVQFDVSGSSEVTLTGSGQDATIDVSGSSRLDLSDFPVEDADVGASGASTAIVNVSGRLDARASGASNIRYLGDPNLGDIDTSGASSVEPE